LFSRDQKAHWRKKCRIRLRLLRDKNGHDRTSSRPGSTWLAPVALTTARSHLVWRHPASTPFRRYRRTVQTILQRPDHARRGFIWHHTAVRDHRVVDQRRKRRHNFATPSLCWDAGFSKSESDHPDQRTNFGFRRGHGDLRFFSPKPRLAATSNWTTGSTGSTTTTVSNTVTLVPSSLMNDTNAANNTAVDTDTVLPCKQ